MESFIFNLYLRAIVICKDVATYASRTFVHYIKQKNPYATRKYFIEDPTFYATRACIYSTTAVVCTMRT